MVVRLTKCSAMGLVMGRGEAESRMMRWPAARWLSSRCAALRTTIRSKLAEPQKLRM